MRGGVQSGEWASFRNMRKMTGCGERLNEGGKEGSASTGTLRVLMWASGGRSGKEQEDLHF